MIEITSSSNDQFRRFQSLTTSKGLKKEGVFLLSGENLIREFLENPKLEIEAEITFNSEESYRDDLPKSARSYMMPKTLFNELDVVGTHHPLLVVKLPKLEEWNQKATEGLTVLTPLGDPGNLGSLLRSCEAFGVKNVVLLQEASHPFLPKAVKASAGSALRLNLKKGPSIDALKENAEVVNHLVALDMNGENLPSFKWPKKSLLLIGEEGRGLPAGLKASHRLKIPTQNVESLNAVVAASLALYDHSLK